MFVRPGTDRVPEKAQPPDEQFGQLSPDSMDQTDLPPSVWRFFGKRWRWSERELRVAQLLFAGLTEKQIAHQLEIETPTVHTHVTALYQKTRCHSRAHFASKLINRYQRFVQGREEPTPLPI